ncbi:T9SS type A sorting domain-containing protein [Kordia zhangzhouensis]|uniref:T9SS type A sorting domain-containing protein n=1 Tax=Kordia zhangzhouensis TaxID=1620405 RepID=UPI000628FB33|nr:T9SS type A sorting domain-containing protein [Kordia zhangzhouensis]
MRKIIIVCFFFIAFSNIAFPQENLIPNGHFDENTSQYNGGLDPRDYYTAGQDCSLGRERFESEITSWYVATSDAPSSELENPFVRRCSPDWIAGYTYDTGAPDCTNTEDSFYLAHGLNTESVMVELKNGYKLIKGQSYKFRVKVRSARGAGSFQLVFSTKIEGLRVQPHKKWVAGDFYFNPDCEWQNIEYYFTVPTDDENDYAEMKYLILQFNHEKNKDDYGHKIAMHYDDVFLAEGEKCEDIKYIQDWQYHNIHKIEQANLEIHAGANVSPYAWDENSPVIVKSTAKVIYRAPTVYLEPGFFIEEPGSYFETQVGTCVEDPCPSIEAFTPTSTTVCSSSATLGENISAQPGVFYSWSPAEYFSNPWSRITDFNPPTGSGCVNAKLVIWTICGESQAFPFTMSYFDTAPSITVNNTTPGTNNLNLDLDISNANSYTVTAVNVANGAVLYTDTQSSSCDNLNINNVLLDLNSCLLDMCDDVEITITASNPCFNDVQEVFTWTAPIPVAPVIGISNIVSTDFDYQFDLALPSSYEYVVIETWDEQETTLICSQTVEACSNPTIDTYHFDVTSCLTGCVSQCHNYKIKVRMKNFCYPTEAVSILSWNKSNTTFSMPSSYPNVITANGDGINDTLCFSPQGADFYHLVVVNRAGNIMFESSGCVTENPVCIWTPPTNIMDDTYFYTIDFSNQCGQSGSNHGPVQVFNAYRTTIDEPDKFDPITTTEISVYPNPSKGIFNVNLGAMSEANMTVLDITGKTVYTKNTTSTVETLNLSKYAKGIYFLKIENKERTVTKKLIIE